jgi:hypothetical protein
MTNGESVEGQEVDATQRRPRLEQAETRGTRWEMTAEVVVVVALVCSSTLVVFIDIKESLREWVFKCEWIRYEKKRTEPRAR